MTAYHIAINRMATGKLPPGDSRWDQFNNSFVNQELEPLEIANAIYTGHAYTAWMNGRRKLENFICAQHIAVDMDTGDARSSFDVLQRHDLVRMYASLMHTTPSHSIAFPRARIIFLLDQTITDAAGYQRAAKFLIAQFGADPACSDASRFFYGCHDCDLWTSENILPLAHLRRFYRKYGRMASPTQPVQKPPTPPVVPPPANKENPSVRFAQDKTDLERVTDALDRIDPWSIDYTKWIAILAALHDAFGDSALPLAKRWGAGKEGEIEQRWRTFGKYGGKRATLASIFDIAGKTH